MPRGFIHRRVWAILVWGLALLLAVGAMALRQQRSLAPELKRESGALNPRAAP